jgi:hypothetical protein
MEWLDRVYGRVTIDDRDILELIETETFGRLKGVRQAGPSALAFPFKNVTRFEHSIGVYVLLARLGAPRREQVAGLLHDISHTAFSHAVDFVYSSVEQAHHETLKPLMLERPDVATVLARMGLEPEMFFDDSIYPLLEQPLPALCADRVDYFLRDGMACGVVSVEFATRILEHLSVVGSRMVLTSAQVGQEAARLFGIMNREWWASDTEAFIYNEFADVLREALRLGVIGGDELMSEDERILDKLDRANSALIDEKLRTIRRFDPAVLLNYRARVIPKERWLDPAIVVDGEVQTLSAFDEPVIQGSSVGGTGVR